MTAALNAHAARPGLLPAVLLGGLWPHVARAHLPPGARKFDRVQAGAVERAPAARDFRLTDVAAPHPRVFAHPASVLFAAAVWRSPFATYFRKQMTTKLFLRDATEVRVPCGIGVGVGSGADDGVVRRSRYTRSSSSAGPSP